MRALAQYRGAHNVTLRPAPVEQEPCRFNFACVDAVRASLNNPNCDPGSSVHTCRACSAIRARPLVELHFERVVWSGFKATPRFFFLVIDLPAP